MNENELMTAGFWFSIWIASIRPQKVTIQALNEFWEEVIVTGVDEMAKCLIHELEH